MKRQFDIGDYVKVIELNSNPQIRKRKRQYKGEIAFIDTDGNLYGTWGGFTINPEIDKIEKS